jgi:amino acid adenylation domain-containing protein
MSSNVDQQQETSYPLTPMQQGMCFHSLYAPEEGLYVQQIVCTLPELLDVDRLQRAWRQVVARHAVLRTAFQLSDPAAAQQIVYQQADVQFALYDWRHLPHKACKVELARFLSADRRRGFALDQAPLMRLALFRFAAAEYRCVWTFHHALLDGRSFLIVLREVWRLYDAGDTPWSALLPPAPPPFRGFVEHLQAVDWSAAEAFWRTQLSDVGAPTTLGLERTTPLPAAEPALGVQQLQLSPERSAALQELADQHQFTLNTLVQGAWALLLSRYSNEEVVVFGATRAGRQALLAGADAGAMVGLLINTLPVRVRVTPELPLRAWLQGLREQWVALRPYEHTPLVQIQQWSGLPPGTPLFTSLLVYEHRTLEASLRAQGGPWANRRYAVMRQVNYPLTLSAAGGPPLELRLEYDRRRFDDPAMTRLLGQLQTLLQAFVQQPQARLAALSPLSAAERAQILSAWNATQRPLPAERCLSQLVEQQVRRTPAAVAVIDHGSRKPAGSGGSAEPAALSYAELNTRANQLAHYLRQHGVGPGVLVAIYLDRSLDLIVGLLAILKAGGAFLPLAPDYPTERLAYMLQDARPQLLITTHELRQADWLAAADGQTPPFICELQAEGPSIDRQPRTNLECLADPDTPAYVIYTSGSTGRPKGALLPRRGLLNLSAALAHSFELGVGDRVLQFASFSFDAAVWELVMALTCGASLVLSRQAILASPYDLLQLLHEARITAATLPPLLLEALPDAELPELRLLVAAGERCTRSQVARWAPGRRMFNAYGPTEATVCASMHLCDPADPRDPPIGRPLANTQLFILDRAGQPVPIGAPGELYIGGAGLALGYLNQPALTAERFVSLPQLGGAAPSRLYQTGDRARYRPDGAVEFLGRLDQQLKIRGHRVEPGEVAAVLRQHQGVREAAVVGQADHPSGARLVAYIVPADVPPAAAAPLMSTLWGWLAERLPAYMLPAAMVALPALPQTPSGKLDLRALPPPERAQLAPDPTYVAPRTPTEQTIAAIWARALRTDWVGVHDSYVALGGHSLLAAQIVFQLRAALGVELPLRAMFELGTVARLASYVEAVRWAAQQGPPDLAADHEQGEL